MRPFALVPIAVILLALGGIFAYASISWTIESRYTVEVVASDTLQWNLFFPRAEQPMTIEVAGTVTVGMPVTTPHGLLENVSGVGDATVKYLLRETVVSLDADGHSVGTRLSPSGRDGSGFWLWRQSADPSGSIRVFGGASRDASRFPDRYSGFLFGYQGDLQEGWTVLQPLAGDGTGLIGTPSAMQISVVFLVSGAAVVGTAIVTLRGRPVQTFK